VRRSARQVGRSSATAHASTAVRPVSRTIWLIQVVRGLPAGRFQPWCGVSPDLVFTASFRTTMCWCAVRQATDVPEDGMTTSGYGAEIRGVGYSTVGNSHSISCQEDAFGISGVTPYKYSKFSTGNFSIAGKRGHWPASRYLITLPYLEHQGQGQTQNPALETEDRNQGLSSMTKCK